MAKKYKCPYCEKRLIRKDLINHINRSHEELIPEGFTATRLVYNQINKVNCGKCRVCSKPTAWNEKSGRYDVLCGNPKCKEHMREEYKKNMLRVRGTYNILNDPEQQKKMLANRSISGTYKFSDGGVLTYTGSYEKKCLEFMDVVMQIPSKDILSPGPTIEYEYNGSKHFYITDFYYIPYNLIIEVKDGGDNPNNKISTGMIASREKTIEKERLITDRGEYNYIRLTNNDFSQLLDVFMTIKEKLLEGDVSKTYKINESVIFENTYSKLNVKTPERLLAWMKSNIKYSHDSNWKLKTFDEVVETKCGDCHDQSLFEYTVFKDLNIKCGRLFMIEYIGDEIHDAGATHTICYFVSNNKYYWFENAWESKRGINGPYLNLDELKKDIYMNWDFSGKYDKLYICNLSGVKPGMGLEEYVTTTLDTFTPKKYFSKNSMNESVILENTHSKYDIENQVKRIAEKVKKDKKDPTGNQNCMLCTWCMEAWFRGYNILPRPVYSPTDKIFDFEGYDIIKRPTKITIKSKNDIKKFVLIAGDGSRFYIHFKWKNGNGGHEFLIINIHDEIYLLDAQSNIFEKITSPKVSSYFRDVDYEKSFIVRVDDKEINTSMLKYNDMEPKEFTPEDMKYIHDNDLIKKEYTDIEGEISINESSESVFDKILKLNDRLNDYEYMIPNNGNPITHIKNDDFIKYYVLLSPNEFEKYKGGVCWDYVAYEAMYFRAKYPNIKFETYYQVIDNRNDNPTHTFLIFEFNKKWYWFESSWKINCGIYGFDNKSDCIEYIMQKLKLPGKNYGTYICKFDATDATMYGMNCVGYMNYMSFIIKPYKFTNKKIEPIFIYKGHCPTDSSHNKYYRVLYGGIGIYEAFKRIVPINVWLEFKKSTACKWLPLPPKYENNYYSYFTYEGYKKFMDLTYPKMLKYLNKDKIETSIVELDENSIVYSDKYQIVATNNNYMIESEDNSELTKDFKSKTSNIQYKTLSIDKPEIYDYLKNHFSKNNPMWEGVKDSKTYMDCFINGNNSRHIKRVGEVLINKSNDEVIGFEVVEKPNNYLAIEIPDKKYRGYGFGNMLLEDAIKKHGCRKLYVAKDNKIAIKMYTNRGFEKTGEFYDGEYWRMELNKSSINELCTINVSNTFIQTYIRLFVDYIQKKYKSNVNTINIKIVHSKQAIEMKKKKIKYNNYSNDFIVINYNEITIVDEETYGDQPINYNSFLKFHITKVLLSTYACDDNTRLINAICTYESGIVNNNLTETPELKDAMIYSEYLKKYGVNMVIYNLTKRSHTQNPVFEFSLI